MIIPIQTNGTQTRIPYFQIAKPTGDMGICLEETKMTQEKARIIDKVIGMPVIKEI